MKMIAEYIENAQKFEQLAAHEKDPDLKTNLENQAFAYRKLARERAKKLGIQLPEKNE